jgi:hypothetical protein
MSVIWLSSYVSFYHYLFLPKVRVIGISRERGQIWGCKRANARFHPQIWVSPTVIPIDPKVPVAQQIVPAGCKTDIIPGIPGAHPPRVLSNRSWNHVHFPIPLNPTRQWSSLV